MDQHCIAALDAMRTQHRFRFAPLRQEIAERHLTTVREQNEHPAFTPARRPLDQLVQCPAAHDVDHRICHAHLLCVGFT